MYTRPEAPRILCVARSQSHHRSTKSYTPNLLTCRWTLLEKAKSGSNVVTVTDGAISLDGLANTNSADAKTSTADLKAFMKAGSGEMLWVNKDDNHFVLLQYSDSFIDNWSAGFRYNGGNRVFTYYDWSNRPRDPN